VERPAFQEVIEIEKAYTTKDYRKIYNMISGYCRAGGLAFIGELILDTPQAAMLIFNAIAFFGDATLANTVLPTIRSNMHGREVIDELTKNIAAWNACGEIYLDAKRTYMRTRDLRSILPYKKRCTQLGTVF
jgi:hypothetical protein